MCVFAIDLPHCEHAKSRNGALIRLAIGALSQVCGSPRAGLRQFISITMQITYAILIISELLDLFVQYVSKTHSIVKRFHSISYK